MGLTARAVGPTLIHDPLGISTLHSSGSAIPVEVLLPDQPWACPWDSLVDLVFCLTPPTRTRRSCPTAPSLAMIVETV